MTNLELILISLGEATTTKLHQDRDSQGFIALQADAREGGEVAGSTREDIEQRTGTPVVSSTNYLHLTTTQKRSKPLEGNEQEKLLDTADE